MEISNEQKLKSISNINKFIGAFKEIRTFGVLCKIDYLKEGKIYLSDTCNCYVRYDNGYPQSEFYINWNYEKNILKKHNLRETYNTTFHIFELEDDVLQIIDKRNIITIEIEKENDNDEKGKN